MTRTATKTQETSAKPPLRPVLLGPPDVVVERRSDGAIVLRSPHPLPAFPQKLTERLVHWAKAAPERVFLAQRDASGAWRTLTYARRIDQSARHRRGAVGARPFAGAPDCNSFRQRYRARTPRPCRHACRHSLRADLGALLAAVEGFRQAQNHHRGSSARPGLCGERHRFRPRHRRRGAVRRRSRGHRKSAGRSAGDAVRGPGERAADAGGRSGACQDRSRHHRQNPVHLRLDRPAQRRHQHPADALRQPGDDRLRPRFRRRRAAGDRRLAAVEPHLRQQPQFQPRAAQWRLALYRRRQAAARRRSTPPYAICATSRRRSISTCRKDSRCCCRISRPTGHCARNSSAG